MTKKTEKLLQNAEELIIQLTQQLKQCLQRQKQSYPRGLNVNLPKPKYTGVGSLQTKCTACQRRRFG